MSNIFKLLVCLVPLVGSIFSPSTTGLAARPGVSLPIHEVGVRTLSIRQPVDPPSVPPSNVVCLNESDLDDEREPNELSKSATAGSHGINLDTLLTGRSLIRASSYRLPLHASSIDSFLRC
jgi:hypothetical protein